MAIPPSTSLDADQKRQLSLSVLIALGPTLWFFDLVAMYAVSTHECGAPLATLSLALAIVSALGTAGALGATAYLHSRFVPSAAPGARSYAFMLQLSFLLNALALVLLLGFLAPLLVLRPCE
jgi:hypothetical protein